MTPRCRRCIALAPVALVWCWMLALAGCQTPWIKKKPSEPEPVRKDDLEPELEFVGDITRAWGLGYMKVEGIALVTRLRGTGSDPPPNDRREALREEMKTNGVTHPDDILALDSTAMVYVRAYLPPGVRKDDRCDVLIESPPRSETTSLRDGWLMQTRLRPVEELGNRLRQGKVLAFAQGPVVIDAVFAGNDDKINSIRGRVLGGGRSLIDRPIGLVVTGENHSLMTTTHLAAAINRRFYAFDHGKKIGVAEPKDDDYIELKISPVYKNNLARYLRVVQSVAIRETPQQRIDRLDRLERLLLEPVSAPRAAERLEAIGQEAIPVLKKGLQSPNAEVRFYSAEALAYLDEAEAAPVLAEAARNSRAWRWHALAALSVITHPSGYEALTELLHSPSAETRCGALRAIQTRNPKDALASGEALGDSKSPEAVVKLVTIPSRTEPLVHFMRYREPQVAVFGQDLRLQAPFSVFAGKEIIVKSIDGGRVKISRFVPGEDERRLECSTRLDDVIRTIVAIGGGYADVLQAVKEAQRTGALAARVDINALPTADRKREASEDLSDDDLVGSSSGPLPSLFDDRTGEHGAVSRPSMDDWEPLEDGEAPRGVWARMKSWFSSE